MSGTQKTEGVRRIWDKYKFAALVALAGVLLLLWPSGREETAERTSPQAVSAVQAELQQEMEDIREWIYRLQDFVRMFGDAIFDACEVGDEKLDHLTQQWLDSDISTIGANIRDIADEYLDGEIDDEAVVSKVKECLDLYLN